MASPDRDASVLAGRTVDRETAGLGRARTVAGHQTVADPQTVAGHRIAAGQDLEQVQDPVRTAADPQTVTAGSD
ncbi:hypothetical protein AK829_01230 [Corynebacterium riegelii]|uniref:Uncharacterized protein n=1 Tax=Corynebacterium riegelii TaxID=156976 RepID=A0A0K1R9E3_9CORY|nr:hypothetical protein AK829_01230 [Corynebacterium riegelii]